MLVFSFLVGIFGLMMASFFLPTVRNFFQGWLFMFLLFSFFFFGSWLMFLTVRRKASKFFLLVGISAVGFLISVLLHNFLYGLAVLIGEGSIFHGLVELLHISFFLVATIICPLSFLIGTGGSLFLLVKQFLAPKSTS